MAGSSSVSVAEEPWLGQQLTDRVEYAWPASALDPMRVKPLNSRTLLK